MDFIESKEKITKFFLTKVKCENYKITMLKFIYTFLNCMKEIKSTLFVLQKMLPVKNNNIKV